MNLHHRMAHFARRAVVTIGVLAIHAGAIQGSEIRFMPIRQAPLGSPAGTVGDPITPVFNGECWEIEIPIGGAEVDIDIQGGGWGTALGSPALGAIQATVLSSGYANGLGGELIPKGWPNSKGDGAYRADSICGAGGNGDPCSPPFPPCGSGFCIPNSNQIFQAPGMNANALCAIATPTLDYGYACAAQNVSNTFDQNPSGFSTFGGLIVNVPADAGGTYLIAADPDPNYSFMTSGSGTPIQGVLFTAACIKVMCQTDADCDDGIASTGDSCNLETGACEHTIPAGQCLIDGQFYANEQLDPEGRCRICDTASSQTDWSFRPVGTLCGLAFAVCDASDTCDDAGECIDNTQPDGTPCDADSNECTDDVCTAGTCTHAFSAAGTSCGDQNDTACNGADTCDGNGNCLDNVLPDNSLCLNEIFCDGAEVCLSGVCEAGSAPCDSEAERCDEDNDRCNILGDFDGDRVVTLADYLHWQDCETGPIGGPYATGCDIFDFEPNDWVDLQDFARLQQAFDGP